MFFDFLKPKEKLFPSVLNFQSTPAIYILGENNHFSKENIIFKQRVKDTVINRQNNFFLALEGEPYIKSKLNQYLEYKFAGIENKIISYYVDCISNLIWMNPATPHSEEVSKKIHYKVAENFWRLCQYVPTFWNWKSDQDKGLREILIKSYQQGICKSFFENMPDHRLVGHSDSLEQMGWYLPEWLEENSDYIYKNESFLEIFKIIVLEFRNFICNRMPRLAQHKCFSDQILNQVFNNKHHFETGAVTTPLMLLFLIELKNESWKENILSINKFAITKGLPVIYIVGDSHIDGLKKWLGNYHWEYRVHYYRSHDIRTSPLCFLDDLGDRGTQGRKTYSGKNFK